MNGAAKPAQFVVTGHTGFIGAGVARSLAEIGEVTGFSRHTTVQPDIRSIALDLSVPLPDMPELAGATVLHCAAEIRSTDWNTHWRNNVDATRHLLDWAVRHRVRRFIFVSTGSVYGFQPKKASEKDPLNPNGAYAHTKYLCEEICKAYGKMFEIDITVFRLYFPFGNGQRAGVFFIIDDALRNNKLLHVNADGGMRFTPVHIHDAITALFEAAQGQYPASTYNLCGNDDISFLELIRRLEERTGQQARIDWKDAESHHMMGHNGMLKAAGWQPRKSIEDWLANYGGAP